MKASTLLLLALLAFSPDRAFSQPSNQFILTGLEEIDADPPGNPPGKLLDMFPIKRENELFLKVTCKQTAWGASFFLKTFHVVPGQTYTFLIDAIIPEGGVTPNIQVLSQANKDIKNVVWPGAKISGGVTKQVFSVPDGITEVSIGFGIVAPDHDAYVLIKDAGFFEGDVSPDQWQPSANEGLQPWLMNSLKHPVQNLLVLNGLGEIDLNPPGNPPGKLLDMFPIQQGNEFFLKVTCQQTAWGSSLFLKTFHVVPGQTYTFLIDAIIPNGGITPNIQVLSFANKNIKVVVWPGAKISGGVTKQVFSVPDGITEIAVGFAIVTPKHDAYLLIKDAGFFVGDVSPGRWVPLENDGLQPWLKTTYWHWLWLLFPMSLITLIVIYQKEKN